MPSMLCGMQQVKTYLDKKEYFQLMQRKKLARQELALNKCFDYEATSNLPCPPRLSKEHLLNRKKFFWETHLIDLFPNFHSYACFCATNKVGCFDEDSIRAKRKESLVKKNLKKR